MRWLHLYGSMLGLVTLLFFAVTGLTLNHAEWFEAGAPTVRKATGTLEPTSLGERIDKLVVAETLRGRHGLRGLVGEFAINDADCIVVFKGPGYSADVNIERATGKYTVEESRRTLFAVLDDLHKGRDSGGHWSVAIDASAVLLTLVAVTGLWLLLYIKRHRTPGLLVTVAGGAVLLLVYLLAGR